MRSGVALGMAALAVGCAHRSVPPAAPVAAAVSGVSVTLSWDAPVDLDLYVTDPARETVYFANPRSASGGVLARDARCADGARGPVFEQARWTTPPPGRYRVGVDFPEACAGARVDEVAYRLAIDVDGRRTEVVGRARVRIRDTAATEFAVGERGER